MSLSDVLTPRPDVLRKEGIEGIIDIQNLWDKKKKSLESRATEFLSLTYPTSDIRMVVEGLNKRYGAHQRTPGLFLLEGLKGSGKSHLELFVYHLLTDPSAAETWSQRHSITLVNPSDVVVLVRKFTDQPLYLEPIWKFVFKGLGVSDSEVPAEAPSLEQFRTVLGNKRLLLILDELEMGIQSLSDQQKAQNISFLQMISEEAHRSETASITLFASVYNSSNEPGATLKRVQPRIDVKFSELGDRQKIILHRLFENHPSLQRATVEPIVTSYANHWNNVGARLDDKYLDRFMQSYPFSPELLDMLLHRVLRREFQGTRGPLGLLATVVRLMHQQTDIITAGHFDVSNATIRNRLSDLDPGLHLIQCAQNDLRDLQNLKHAPEIVSAVLLSTLTATGNLNGIGEQELIRQVLNPGDDINVFNSSLNAFERLATYLQHSEASYFFDVQEKPNAKVEYRSLRIDALDALEFALNRWKVNVFDSPQAVIHRDLTQTKSALSLLDRNSLRFVLAPRRLDDNERGRMYHGVENQNQVILLEPKSDSFNALKNPDIVKWAQRAKAAKELMDSAGDSDRRRQYERIGGQDLGYIDDTFKKAGLYYVSVRRLTNGSKGLQYELEPLGSAIARQDVLAQLQQTIYPRQVFEEHITACLHDSQLRELILNQTINEIRATYRKTLGFPVFTAHPILIDAFRNLCKEKKVTLQNTRTRHCGSNPSFVGSEWDDVLALEPSEETVESSGGTDRIFVDEGGSFVGTVDPSAGRAQQSVSVAPRTTVEIRTENVSSLSLLRQEVAAKLAEMSDATVVRARYVVYLHKEKEELSSLPATLRGSLSGIGDISLEMDIVKEGEFTKAQVEQLSEQLPSLAGAMYRAELRILVPQHGEGDAS